MLCCVSRGQTVSQAVEMLLTDAGGMDAASRCCSCRQWGTVRMVCRTRMHTALTGAREGRQTLRCWGVVGCGKLCCVVEPALPFEWLVGGEGLQHSGCTDVGVGKYLCIAGWRACGSTVSCMQPCSTASLLGWPGPLRFPCPIGLCAYRSCSSMQLVGQGVSGHVFVGAAAAGRAV